MPHKIGFVDNSNGQLAHYNMLEVIHRFCAGYGSVGMPAFTGTGNGQIVGADALPLAVTETWTLTCTVAPGTFSVVGSVSGIRADATVGVAYNNGLLALTLSAGSTPFALGDEFELPVTQGAAAAANAEWKVLRYNTGAANRELILSGKGYTGAEEIFVGFRTYQDASADYYNLVAAVFTGYVPGNTFDTQPGARLSGVPAHNNRIDYWLTLNPQRIALAMKVGTPVYESCYVGKFLPYARPSQYPYPVVCSGMLVGAAATRFSDATANHSFGFKGNSARLGMRSNDEWRNVHCFPWGNTWLAGTAATTNSRNVRDTGNSYQLFPIELHDNVANLWGALDGIFYISGFNNAVENTLSIGGESYVVVQDSFRTGHTDYIAMRMDN